MLYKGSFYTINGEEAQALILTRGDRSQTVEIGDPDGGLFFSDDPVEIASSVNDTFDHLLRSEATIRLQARGFVPDLFQPCCLDAAVNIIVGGRCVFAGFIEPQAYSQDFCGLYDDLELSCIDALSALQYAKHRGVGSPGVLYESVRAAAGQLTFAQAIGEIFSGVAGRLDIAGLGGARLLYDGSKAIDASAARRHSVFSDLSISELLFLGDDEEGAWTQDKTLESMLKYLNLHIAQQGLDFYVFSWETVKGGGPIEWRGLASGAYEESEARRVVDFSSGNAADCGTQLSIGEAFNRIVLTCDVKSAESVIENPLDEDGLASPYSNKQLYMTEYSSDGEGTRAFNEFFAMTHGTTTGFEGGTATDWYMQVKDNPAWTFPSPQAGGSLVGLLCRGNADQQALPNWLAQRPGAAIISFGKVEKKSDLKDNSPIAKVDMESFLVVAVNGNGEDSAAKAYPSEASLLAAAPVAVYEGGAGGAVYSPADSAATNYLVISGKIALNPIMELSGEYGRLSAAAWGSEIWTESPIGDHPLTVWRRTVPSRNNGDGRYYTQKFYKAATPFDAPSYDSATQRGLSPFTGTGPQECEFKYSAIGDGTDTVSKVAALACMLVIGDKCLVETGTDGQISDFSWRPFKERTECASDDEYYQQSFTIGFNPKIGDRLIGTEFDIQNNIDFTLGIDAEGTAIPIRKADRLGGAVRFMILGPVNALWSDITRRHPTWFRHTSWNEASVPLMAHVSSIFIKGFEIKVYSDNGLVNNAQESDIVYMSDTREEFVNPKDDITFEISSALTVDECRELGVADSVKLSTPADASTGEPVLEIYDYCRGMAGKPEQMYVDSYWTECRKPRVMLRHKLDDRDGLASLFNIYRHPALPGREFYAIGMGRNIIGGSAELILKEVWND